MIHCKCSDIFVAFVLPSALCCLAQTGCGSDLARVTGTVTLDGKPLPAATVEFQPKEGSPSYGETDANGRYELMFAAGKPGAQVGEYTVRISTFRIEPDGEARIEIPERVPAEFNENSTVVRKVKPGSQTFDFEIPSK